MTSKVFQPVKHVAYWIKNVDSGTVLTLINIPPPETKKSKPELVTRPINDDQSTKAQQWVFDRDTNGQYVIKNLGNACFYYLDHAPSAQKTPSGDKINKWVIQEGHKERQIVRLECFTTDDSEKFLALTSNHMLETAEERPKDNAKWQLVEVCPILGQKGYKYRLRSLNGRILVSETTSNGSMLKAMILSEATIKTAVRTQWTVEPTAAGACIIQLAGGGANDYLHSTEKGGNSGKIAAVSVLTTYPWNLQDVGRFGFVIKRDLDDREMALTVDNDTDIILKTNKVGHGQIWLVERDFT